MQVVRKSADKSVRIREIYDASVDSWMVEIACGPTWSIEIHQIDGEPHFLFDAQDGSNDLLAVPIDPIISAVPSAVRQLKDLLAEDAEAKLR